MDTKHIIEKIEDAIRDFHGEIAVQEVGRVIDAGDGVAKIAGLDNAMMSEMVTFCDTEQKPIADGVVLNLEEYTAGAVILGAYENIHEGMPVQRTKKILSVPVGDNVIGRVVDALGRPKDGLGSLTEKARYPIEKIAPGVIARESVSTPLQTGIKAIDAMIPIGRGQRELIIGDRQTGKTAIAIDTIINQKGENVIAIYVAIGQKESKVAKTVARLKKEGAMEHTIVVSAAASEAASLWYVAPFAGAAIGEYFMDQGRDVLIVYDDLSKHAWAYRQISLLLRRPPGREAYPGDIFYLHSRLLERAAKLSQEYGGGSMTALPIIETQAGDVSAYIPTNVISITDGQIYLESDLFYRGVRPAVNVGLSVSRVGGAAQIKAMKRVAGRLRLDLAQFRELEAFAQFASDLDPVTRAQIERGRRLTEILKQPQYAPAPVAEQVAILYAAVNGYLDDIPVQSCREFEDGLRQYIRGRHPEIFAGIIEKKDMDEELEDNLKKAINEYKKLFVAEHN